MKESSKPDKQKPKVRPFSQDFSGPSKTDESFAPACDVNAIVAHYEIGTPSDPFINRKHAERFGDATGKNYLDAMRQTAEVNSAFLELSAPERSRHDNDPSLWLDSLALEIDAPAPAEEPSPEPDPAPQETSGPDSTEEVQ